MTLKRILAILCCLTILVSSFGMPVFAQDASSTDVPTQADPTIRRVYLHANGKNPTDTVASVEKSPGDTFDLYFAVDTPNKGAHIVNAEADDQRLKDARADAISKAAEQIAADALKAANADPVKYPIGSTARAEFIAKYTADAEETIGDQAVAKARRLQPQYDMNGYSVKIYFDPRYLDYQDTSSTQPIVYTCPSDMFDDDTTKEEVEGEEFDVPAQVGYFPYRNGKTTKTIDGVEYNCAYATVFVSGTWLPDETTPEAWYNLCALPLKVKEGVRGGTTVFVEFEAPTTDPKIPYTTELFAKDVEGYSPTFTALPEHGGSFYIEFTDQIRPDLPKALPEQRIHTTAQSITLTAEEGCKIYYTTDGSDPQVNITGREEYKGPFNITTSTTVRAFAQRTTGDMRTSYTATFEYKIVPEMPYLYLTKTVGSAPIADNAYESDNTYTVYVSERSTYAEEPIDAATHAVYYTFSAENPDNLSVTGNPETGWALVDYVVNEIEITESRVVRLKTVSKIAPIETSEINAYYLDIQPKKPTASPAEGFYTTPQKVTLTCATENAKIYYVVGDGDAKLGAQYNPGDEIPINGNKTIRAIAKVGDKWSDVAVLHYFVESQNDYGVDAYYPSGTYEESVDVTLTPIDSDNKVWYKIDNDLWQEYTGKITLTEDATISTQVEDPLGKRHDSDVFIYEVVPEPPHFSPESTQFTTTATVGVFALDHGQPSRYKLYYTLDGTSPIDNPNRKLATMEGSPYNTTLSQPITGYTVISAVVLKDDEKYSEVVTHSYDIVTKKPVKPVPTLLPGEYTVSVDGGETYSTQFSPVLADTQIYYTTDGTAPDPTNPAHLYTPGTDIPVTGDMTIKAIAVNAFSGQSDLGVFSYTIRPETPVAPPSGTIKGSELPILPVSTVPGSTVKYTIGDVEAAFACPSGQFYIDSYGNAYADEACTQPIWEQSTAKLTAPVILEITATYNGVESLEGQYRYALSDAAETLAPPYADKNSGRYDEVNYDGQGNYLRVKLDSLNADDTIEYRKDYKGEFLPYTDADGIPLTGDTVLEIRAKKTLSSGETVYSNTATYLYEFFPLAPVILPVSGRYDEKDDLWLSIGLQAEAPAGANYTILYRANGDGNDAVWTPGVSQRPIQKTMSVKAYVVNNVTQKHSEDVIQYYILESDVVEGGNVSIAPPYAADPNMAEKRISEADLDEAMYAQGIRLTKDAQAPENSVISYKYVYYDLDGNRHETDWADYVNNPIHTSVTMDYIIVSARLVGPTGVITEKTFPTIDFIHLGVPTTSLEGANKTEFDPTTTYTLFGPEDSKPNMYIYYTTDGRDPRLYGTLYTPGTSLPLTKTTTVKAVYFSGCGKCKDVEESQCHNGAYGEVGSYTYAVPTKEIITTGGGGGGGGTKVVDNTRKYTVDFFGYEHPTHVGYIKGYPDGSVQPDGKITREEIAAILYRIKHKEYDAPFTVTGKVFPDVEIDRWSATEVEYMTNDGVIVGYPDGEFKPANHLTRAEFAALVCRFAGLESKNAANPFADLKSDHWAYSDIMALYEAGLITGYEDHSFRPENQITRAEVMTVINKLLGRNPSESYVKALGYNPFSDLLIEKWYYVIVLEATITHNYYLDKTGLEIEWEDIR